MPIVLEYGENISYTNGKERPSMLFPLLLYMLVITLKNWHDSFENVMNLLYNAVIDCMKTLCSSLLG